VTYAPVPQFPGYFAGDDGSIWSNKSGGWRQRKLTPNRKMGGRLFVCLAGPNGNRTRWVHRLVLESFIGPCPDGSECCHNNGDRLDNRLENLRWDTHESNVADAERHGSNRDKLGTGNAKTKLTEESVRELMGLYRAGWGKTALARRFGVGFNTVVRIVNGYTWSHVTGVPKISRRDGRGKF
jgi:hypothetical protein